MKFQPQLKISAFALILSWSNISVAQEQDSLKNRQFADSVLKVNADHILWWLTLGYGASNISESGDFSACVGAFITLKYGHSFFSARVIHDQGVNFFTPNQMVFDAALLYGIGYHRELWFGSASIGMAYTATTKAIFVRQDTINFFPHDIYRGELFRGIGLAGQVQLFSKFSDSSHVGLGITVCGNLNKSFPFWMLLFSLEFGNF